MVGDHRCGPLRLDGPQVESLLLEAGASCYVSGEAAGIHLYGAIPHDGPRKIRLPDGKRGTVLPASETPP